MLERAALASGSSTSRRRRSGRRCWTRARYLCSSADDVPDPRRRARRGPRAARPAHPPAYAKPELLAERPNELWSLGHHASCKGPAKWTYFYLYVILDVFSRYVVGWTVQHRETAQLAKALIAQATEQQQITPEHADAARRPRQPDALQAGRVPARRPRRHARRTAGPYTSTDNPYSEAHFKTLKYRPEFPARFDSIEHARALLPRRSSTGTTTRTATPGSA